MATGSLNDPFIVKDWAEFLEYNTAEHEGDYVQFPNKLKWDLSTYYPHGLSGGLVIYPNILGNEAHLMRLCILGTPMETTALTFMGTVENLYIDGLYAYNIATFAHTNAKLTGVRIVAEVENGDYTFDMFNTTVTLDFEDCEFCLKAHTMRSIYFNGSSGVYTMYLTNTDIDVEFDLTNERQQGFVTISNVDLTSSRFKGNIKVAGTSGRVILAMWQHYPYENTQSIWDVKVAASQVIFRETLERDALYYNSDKMTFTSAPTNWIALTNEQIASESAMVAAGFPIGGDSPWDFTFGYLDNVNWITLTPIGAFAGNVPMNKVVIPQSLESVGRYAFTTNQLGEVNLPDACTYYSTSFKRGVDIHGGTLIDD